MAINTYAELVTSVGNWLARTDLSARIPEFISIGEARINREVRSRLQEQRVTTTSDDYISLPSDFLSLRSLWVTANGRAYPLKYLQPDMLLQQFAGVTTGAPTHYTLFGDEVRFGPPSADYPVELWYFKRLPPLSGALNTVFTNNPDLYLYAALTAAIPFLKDDKRVGTWESLYAAVRDQLGASEKEGRYAPGMGVSLA